LREAGAPFSTNLLTTIVDISSFIPIYSLPAMLCRSRLIPCSDLSLIVISIRNV
jgi:hypothetical protein